LQISLKRRIYPIFFNDIFLFLYHN